MKALKAVGQVLAAIIYSCIFTGLMYLILVMPLAWLLTLNTGVLILAVIFLGGIIQAIIVGAQVLLMMPYAWIVKKNIVALILSIGLILFNLIRSDVIVWQGMLGNGRSAVVLAIIVTILIIEALIMSIAGIISVYSEND